MVKIKNAALAAAVLGLLTAPVFADPGGFDVSASIYSDAIGVTSYTGDYADEEKSDYLGPAGIVVFPLGSSIFDTDTVNDDINVNFSYEHEDGIYGGRAQIIGPVNGLRKGAIQLGWFGAWLKPLNFLQIYVGNEFKRGMMSRYRYANFNDFVPSMEKDFGAIYFDKPSTANVSAGLPLDAGFAIYRPNPFVGGVIFTLEFDKVTIDLGSQNVSTSISPPFFNASGATKAGGTTKWGYQDNSFGFKARVDVSGIAGIVNLEAVAHYNGSATQWDDPAGAAKDGTAAVADSQDNTALFGIYGNIQALPRLGITVGYSGRTQFGSTETYSYAAEAGGRTAKAETVYPFWHGINLNTYFNGIRNVRITFNNNLSFSNIAGESDASMAVHGIFTDTLTAGVEDKWLAVFNGVDVKYLMHEKLTLDAAIANKIGIATVENASGSVNHTYDSLSIYAGVIFEVDERAKIEAGLAFNNTSYSNDAASSAAYGVLRFGVPMRLTIQY
ncbi:MAG: hypothetical protein LBU16_08675 [Treponema sp.]|jgi:hypothetical protein|nr:hypothetical protein [Treponema sp.]